ncbi:MAG: cytochrome c3 family protein [bacterium]|jgi:hypothetical protein
MEPIFTPRANSIAVLVGLGVLSLVIGFFAGITLLSRSSLVTGVDMVVDQPVPFSHAHHVGGLGIDCRYCHSSVETSAFAGMPSLETCMSCHRQIWTEADMLRPVREGYKNGEPVRWNRVYDLPDFVYFDHSIHVNKGISCVTCHGPVDQMPLMKKATTLQMRWCLDCHRAPGEQVQPRDAIFAVREPSPLTEIQKQALVHDYHIETRGLTNCSICHR